ncbi:SCO6880 family protein [Sporichthya polymorpha]|uniref:SCO6880 family protein n=1 Tax=Sporichthya polymorpha TaxID=35751 RepID=UPI001FE0E772|nr:SCO6880 family protein [Sporichthya polymorpha]
MSGPASQVRFGGLERRGLLLGLTGAQVALLGAALTVVVGAGLIAGPAGVVVTAPGWAIAAGCALIPVGGRPLVEVAPTSMAWTTRRVIGVHRVLARPERPQAGDPLELPGLPRPVHITVAGSTQAAVIRLGRPGLRGPVTVVAEVRGRGLLLEDPGVQDRRVSAWGRLLAAFGQMPEVGTVQVLHRKISTGPRGVREWWVGQRTGPAWATAIVEDLVADTAQTTRLQTLLAVELRPRDHADLDAVMSRLHDAIDAAELDLIAWLTPHQIQTVVRQAYDPATHVADATGEISCAPMGVAEEWAHARSDFALHATYWVSEWPRSGTHASFLRPLLLAPGARRTFTLLASPLPPGKALREIRRARAEQMADAAARTRIGRVEEEAHRAAADELTRREQDLVAGHGDLRFTGLLTVSATTPEELTAACEAGCDLRRLVGQQVAAFAAAALPFARGLS